MHGVVEGLLKTPFASHAICAHVAADSVRLWSVHALKSMTNGVLSACLDCIACGLCVEAAENV